MRSRWLLLVPFLLMLGCGDKTPEAPVPAAATPTAALETSTLLEPLTGTVDGKPAKSFDVSFDGITDGTILSIRPTDPGSGVNVQVLLPGPEGEKLQGKEWVFGGKIEDSVLSIVRGNNMERQDILGPDYSMVLRIDRQTRDSVEGFLELTVKNPAGTALKGEFIAVYRKSPTAPLGPDETPYVHGKITVKGAMKTETLAAGFIGIGTDGKPDFNEASFPVEFGVLAVSSAAGNAPGQISKLSSSEDSVAYRHLNMPPGDYLVYVRREGVMSAWKRVKLKEGDQHMIDLTLDPATMGEVVVTLPDAAEATLALVPLNVDIPDLGLGSEQHFNVALVKMGEKTVTVSRVPAGRYRALRGTDQAEVEVVAGKSVAVTLVPAKK